ncbi:restriction endonuclease subunit R [Methylorubrum populi]|uniref:Restriction endonuclease subunit R n=1 Tax=Methylobacterium radiotolerans TaxID=31998 RepID=A0ABU7T6L7_9HYPH
MSNFAFLLPDFPHVQEAAEAERQAASSPTAAAFFAGKAVEVAVKWAFRNDPGLKLPYQDNIAALLHEPSFKRLAGPAVFTKAKYINTLRNRAVHEEKTISASEAAGAVKELFHVCFWFARTYARGQRPADGLAFEASQLTRREDVVRRAFVQLQKQQKDLEAKDGELTKLLASRTELDAELTALRAEVAAARKANAAVPDTHDYGEAETRDRFIDLLLKEAGWALDRPEDTEFEVAGMPSASGVGFVDYVLWGLDGKPLGLVEAKATKHSAQKGQQQAKLYADALEKMSGQRPVIFLSNGYEHWIWDDRRYPPREIGGFYKRDELELAIQRRTSRKSLADTKINLAIAGKDRPYQQRAIRAITNSFEAQSEEVVNLVFFKQVRSKTKFWQMMGRGTRLCEDLFGPGDDKTFFRVFDYCSNLEFFGAAPEMKDPGAAASLSERLFAARLDLVRALDDKWATPGGFAEDPAPYDSGVPGPPTEETIRIDAVAQLRETIAGMNLDNFVVRQRRRVVEKYLGLTAWISIDAEARDELVEQVAPLPTAKRHGTEEAKRFDLLMFSLQLALLRGSNRFATLRTQLLEIASSLEEQTAIPSIAAQAALIEEIQTDSWWEGVTVSLLELVRLRLRDLIQHIEKRKRGIVYSDFADEIGEGVTHDLPQVGEVDFVRFKAKARAFLKKHEDHIALSRLRHGKALTPTDLVELEKMLVEAGIGDTEAIERAREASAGFGRFVRSLVGLDRQAVNDAFAGFLGSGTASREQIEFVGLVVDHLTAQGVMEPGLLYESPFTDVAPQGPEQVFDDAETSRLFEVIDALNRSAVA